MVAAAKYCLNVIFKSSQAHCHLSGLVISRIWRSENIMRPPPLSFLSNLVILVEIWAAILIISILYKSWLESKVGTIVKSCLSLFLRNALDTCRQLYWPCSYQVMVVYFYSYDLWYYYICVYRLMIVPKAIHKLFYSNSTSLSSLRKYSASMKPTFWSGKVGMHAFSGKVVLKVICGRPWATWPSWHQGSNPNLFPFASLVTDKPRARENLSSHRWCSSPRCDVDTSHGLCLYQIPFGLIDVLKHQGGRRLSSFQVTVYWGFFEVTNPCCSCFFLFASLFTDTSYSIGFSENAWKSGYNVLCGL